VVEDNEHREWSELSNALGEALLDVERTFLDIVERQAATVADSGFPAACAPALKAYFDAWSRLDGAHVSFSRYLEGRGTPLHLMALRCGQCSQELR
jgi:hypothetical protein